MAWDKNFNVVEQGDLASQTDMVYQNIEHALNEIGATWDYIVKTTVYTTMPNEYEIIGNTTAKFFGHTRRQLKQLLALRDLRCLNF